MEIFTQNFLNYIIQYTRNILPSLFQIRNISGTVFAQPWCLLSLELLEIWLIVTFEIPMFDYKIKQTRRHGNGLKWSADTNERMEDGCTDKLSSCYKLYLSAQLMLHN